MAVSYRYRFSRPYGERRRSHTVRCCLAAWKLLFTPQPLRQGPWRRSLAPARAGHLAVPHFRGWRRWAQSPCHAPATPAMRTSWTSDFCVGCVQGAGRRVARPCQVVAGRQMPPGVGRAAASRRPAELVERRGGDLQRPLDLGGRVRLASSALWLNRWIYAPCSCVPWLCLSPRQNGSSVAGECSGQESWLQRTHPSMTLTVCSRPRCSMASGDADDYWRRASAGPCSERKRP